MDKQTDRQKDRININSMRLALRAVIGEKMYCLFDVQMLKDVPK